MRRVDVDRRVLGAVRCVDVNTNLPVEGPIRVMADGLKIIQNRLGDFVITGAQGFPELEAHTGRFLQPPPEPAIGSESVVVDVADGSHRQNLPFDALIRDLNARYLPRRVSIDLPRDPDPNNVESSSSLFRPIEIPLFPTLVAQPPIGATLVRAVVTSADRGQLLPGALIRITRSNGNGEEVMARGMTHWSGHATGEAVVPVTGIPLTTWDDSSEPEDEDSPVLTTEVSVSVQAIWDPAVDFAGGALPDPDDLESRRNDLLNASSNLQLAFGRHTVARLSINIQQ